MPNMKIPVFFAQRRPERDRDRMYNNHPVILDEDQEFHLVNERYFKFLIYQTVGERQDYFHIKFGAGLMRNNVLKVRNSCL